MPMGRDWVSLHFTIHFGISVFGPGTVADGNRYGTNRVGYRLLHLCRYCIGMRRDY